MEDKRIESSVVEDLRKIEEDFINAANVIAEESSKEVDKDNPMAAIKDTVDNKNKLNALALNSIKQSADYMKQTRNKRLMNIKADLENIINTSTSEEEVESAKRSLAIVESRLNGDHYTPMYKEIANYVSNVSQEDFIKYINTPFFKKRREIAKIDKKLNEAFVKETRKMKIKRYKSMNDTCRTVIAKYGKKIKEELISRGGLEDNVIRDIVEGITYSMVMYAYKANDTKVRYNFIRLVFEAEKPELEKEFIKDLVSTII